MHLLSSLRGTRTLAGSLTLLCLLFLAGCGFQLRGTGGESLQLDSLQVSAEDPHSNLLRDLVSSLQRQGVTISSAADYHLRLGEESYARRAISPSGRATPGENVLTGEITFVITDRQARPLVGPHRLSAERTYVTDRDNVVGNSQQAELLQQELQRELGQQLLRRLSSLSSAELAARQQALDP